MDKLKLLPYEHFGRRGKPNPLKHQPATYFIVHPETEKMYIGSTGDLSRRCGENLKTLEGNRHKNKPLQEAYNRDPLVCILYTPCKSKDEAEDLEQILVKSISVENRVFNVAIEDTRLTAKGRTLSDGHIEALRRSNHNRVVSEQARERMSEAQKNYFKTEEGQKRLKEMAASKGKPVRIAGVDYPSISEASRQLDIPWTTLSKRIKGGSI